MQTERLGSARPVKTPASPTRVPWRTSSLLGASLRFPQDTLRTQKEPRE